MKILEDIFYNEDLNIDVEKFTELENELQFGLEKIKNRTLTEEEWLKFSDLPSNFEESISYLKNTGILESR